MKRYIAFFVFLLLMLLFLAGLFVSGARADIKLSYDKHYKSLNNWSVGFSDTQNGCVTKIKYTNGVTLWIGYHTYFEESVTWRMYIALTKPTWSVDPVDNIDLELIIDRSRWTTESKPVTEPEPGVVFLVFKDELVKDFRSAKRIILRHGGETLAHLSLRGSNNAIGDMWGCQQKFIDVFQEFVDQQLAKAPEPTTPTPRHEEPTAPKSTGNGTGFYVSKNGHILTNNHVTQSCKSIKVVTSSGNTVVAKVLQADQQLDLSLLQTELKMTEPVDFAVNIELGESSYAFGYPLQGLLSTDGNFTSGIVTGTSGLNGDFKYFQTSTPVQPGNSGGALFNENGKVIGVVTYKLNAMAVAQATNDIPQNVNFAVKAGLARAFVEMAGIDTTNSGLNEKLSSANIAKKAQKVSVKVECY